MGNLNCDVIHMEVSLDLMRSHAPERAELRTRLEISIPGREFEGCQWQTVTSLIKPDELYRDPREDPPLEAKAYIADVLSVSDAETRIKIPFPAVSWAHAFTSLTDLQLRHEDSQRHNFGENGLDSHTGPARELTKQISMYQEVQSCAGLELSFVRRAIILWTFRKVREGEAATTSWRYIDASPPRSSCMSPSPRLSHHITATMSENFNSFLDNTIHPQNPNMLESFVPGISTPTTTAALQSPFASAGYSCPNQNYELSHDINFDSTATLDSESTLVDEAAHINNILSNGNVSLGDYDHNPTAWNLSHSESFDADSTWTTYANVPSSTPQLGWVPNKNQSWQETTDKQPSWLDDVNGKQEWASTSPNKQDLASFDQNLTKVPSWNETGNDYSETRDAALPELITEPVNTKVQSWTGSDGFDYAAIADRLK
jgi:transcriptional enhancer factor